MKKTPFIILRIAIVFATRAMAQERLYVVQYNDESLGRIDPSTGSVQTRVLDLGYGCNEIIAHGTRLYVANSFINTVQEIDAVTETTIRDIPMTGGVSPYSIAVVNDDTLAVTHFISNNVLLVRLSDGAIVGNIPVGPGPEGIIAHGERVYVCRTGYSPQGYGAGRVMIYDRRTFVLLDSLSVGMNPQFAAVDDIGRLHVVCTGNYTTTPGTIWVVDLSGQDDPVVLPVGGTPATVSFGGGLAFLAAGGWGGSGQVFRYRLSDLTILNSAANPISTGPGANDIEAWPDGSFFVSCGMSDRVEHRAAEGTLLTSYPMGAGTGFMVRYASESSVSPRLVPNEPLLMEAFPNPFNSSVRLRVNSPDASGVIIGIYNTLGQSLATFYVKPGTDGVTWHPGDNKSNLVSTGAYFAVAASSDRRAVVRINHLR